MEIVTLIGQIILILAYGIGVLIVIKNQRREIRALKTQIETQTGILSSMQTFINIFDPKKVEGYVKIIEETAKMEKEEALKKHEEEIKAKAKTSIDFLMKEQKESFRVLNKLSFVFAHFPFFVMTIEEMESTTTKEILLESIKKEKDEAKAQGLDEESTMPLIKLISATSVMYKKRKSEREP